MRRAVELAEAARAWSSPNPWVGCVVVADGERFEGCTSVPGGPHAEAVALRAAGEQAKGATLFTTLEPCSHAGRTAACAETIVAAGVSTVVVGLEDPDPNVSGRGLERLREAGVEVRVGQCQDQIREQLAPYLKHRRTGRPWVVLKLATTLDGRIAAPDGSSRWITGPEAREDAHQLRGHSDAVLVGAGTVRADDPQLTRRDTPGTRQPVRVVLGRAKESARVNPALEMEGEPEQVLDGLGAKGVLQLLVEGGAVVAHEFHSAGLVDRYVIYVAPALFGGDDAVPMFRGAGAAGMETVWRGRFISIRQLGADIRLEVA